MKIVARGQDSGVGNTRANHRGHGEGKPQRARRTRRKTNHGGHGGHGEKQTTEDTEDTEKNKPRRARRWEEGSGWRWSAQSCGLDGVGTPAQLGIVSLCRRDRRHGKPGGLLHGGSGRCSKLHAGRTRWSAPTWRGIGLCGGRWVKGAEAGWKAGRRLESLPHNSGLHHSPVRRGAEGIRRQDWRRGTQDCVLHANIRCGT